MRINDIHILLSDLKHRSCMIGRRIRMRLLRKKALRTRDDEFRLAVARRLNDESILRKVALEAGSAALRKEAADTIRQPALLAGIALNAWDIELGRKVVSRLDNALLLRRVARSARQDAIRLAAAKKLGHSELLKEIALATADVSLRWEAAQHLKDPELMADVALIKPGHAHLEKLSRQARSALHGYLDELERQGDANALLSFILIQHHLPFKLEAFLRLPAGAVNATVLLHLSRHHFIPIGNDTIRSMLRKIGSAGWALNRSVRAAECLCCKGSGVLALKTVSTAQSRVESAFAVCPDCGGRGRVAFQLVVCTDRINHRVEFTLPYSQEDPEPEAAQTPGGHEYNATAAPEVCSAPREWHKRRIE